jgi:hypothetical protein
MLGSRRLPQPRFPVLITETAGQARRLASALGPCANLSLTVDHKLQLQEVVCQEASWRLGSRQGHRPVGRNLAIAFSWEDSPS